MPLYGRGVVGRVLALPDILEIVGDGIESGVFFARTVGLSVRPVIAIIVSICLSAEKTVYSGKSARRTTPRCAGSFKSWSRYNE